MTCGGETWTLNSQAQKKLAATQTKMERSMLDITHRDRKTRITCLQLRNYLGVKVDCDN